MKKTGFLTMLMVFTMSVLSLNFASAQSHEKAKGKNYVEALDEGRVLNQTDIRFFNSITNNGNDGRTAVVYGKKYNAGQRLSIGDAAMLNKAKSDFRKKHMMERADDGKAIDRNHYPSSNWYKHSDDANNHYYVWYND